MLRILQCNYPLFIFLFKLSNLILFCYNIYFPISHTYMYLSIEPVYLYLKQKFNRCVSQDAATAATTTTAAAAAAARAQLSC